MTPQSEGRDSNGPSHPEFERILNRIWDDDFNEGDSRKLQELLAANPGLRLKYLEAKITREQLAELCQRLPTSTVDSATHTDKQLATSSVESRAVRANTTAVPRWWLGRFAVSAALLLIALGYGLSQWLSVDRPKLPDRTLATSTPEANDSIGVVSEPAIAHIVDAVSNEFLELFPADANRGIVVGTTVELDAGVTELRFDCGANVVVAGPAHLAIKGPKRVELLVGSITVQMDKGIDGFEVVTPDGKVTDLGTAFGVHVSAGQDSSVSVFEGEVEILPSDEANQRVPARLIAGEAAQFRHSRSMKRISSATNVAGLRRLSLERPDYVIPAFKDAYIRGRDWIHRYEVKNFGSREDLLVKYESAASQSNRRAWIGFDLRDLKWESLIGARFNLTVLPNHLAEDYRRTKNVDYTESDTTWVFEVAGLWDLFYENWNEESITWQNAPGNSPETVSGRVSGPHAPVTLGTFAIQGTGKERDQIVISGPELLEFLRADDDGIVTLIVTRRTPCVFGSSEDIVVHGFASREHTTLSPPTLKLWSNGERSQTLEPTDDLPGGAAE